MKENFFKIKIALLTIILAADIFFYMCINNYFSGKYYSANPGVNIVFWLIPILFVITIIQLKFDQAIRESRMLSEIYRLSGLFFILYFPKIVFIIFNLINFLSSLVFNGILRLVNIFISNNIALINFQFISAAGLVLSGVICLMLLYGMVIGRFQFKTENLTFRFSHLPEPFNGLRIVQISDIHLGSWYRHENQMEKAVNIINNLNPDLILFTGDLVNNFSEEADGWTEILQKLKAKSGKYSILGNHDYGDYWDWKDEQEKSENMELLYKTHRAIGFKLLMNQSDTIALNGHEIGIIGVENWGKPPFMQYGDLKKATENLKSLPFKILLSHDPSHWTAEVYEKTDIDLTLSGHTHAMQFGFKIGKNQWSPVKYIYKFWSGLYGNNGQYLYVNRGLGSLGFPGRVGMRPEITLITLHN